jgi:hypothetical protein
LLPYFYRSPKQKTKTTKQFKKQKAPSQKKTPKKPTTKEL